MSSLCAAATAVTWDQLAEMQSLWLDADQACVDERSLRRHWDAVVLLIELRPIMNPLLRYQHMHPCFPKVTCMLDGSVIPVCSRMEQMVWDRTNERYVKQDRAYSGKHGTICVKVEVWTTLDGIPLFVRGGVPGSWHDAKLFTSDSAKIFPHAAWELFLTDGGYVGCDHCLCPYQRKAGLDLNENQSWYNDRHALVRSRVERLFAFLDVFKIMSYCDNDAKFVLGAVTLACSAFFLLVCNRLWSNIVGGSPQFWNAGVLVQQRLWGRVRHRLGENRC
jgi:hypothetical protein